MAEREHERTSAALSSERRPLPDAAALAVRVVVENGAAASSFRDRRFANFASTKSRRLTTSNRTCCDAL